MGKADTQTVIGAWTCAQTLHRSQGLKSALVSLERDVRQLVQSGNVGEALQLAKKTFGLCSTQALSLSPAEAVSVLRQAKALLDLVERNTQDSVFFSALFSLQLLAANSLANAFKSAHDLYQAYTTLVHAIELIHNYTNPPHRSTLQYMASTLVNCSTIQLDLKMFPEAIKSAEHCLHLLQSPLSRVKKSSKSVAVARSRGAALFNIAVAKEALGDKHDALNAYMTFVQFSHECKEFGETEAVSEAEAAIKELQNKSPAIASDIQPETPSLPRLSLIQHKAELPSGYTDIPKYYSEKRLAQLHAMIARGSKSTFVSSQEYFGLQVKKELRLDEDLKHLEKWQAREGSSTDRNDERKGIVKLRQRRYRRRIKGPAEPRGLDCFCKCISALQQEPPLPAPHSFSPRAALTTRTPSSPRKSDFFLTALRPSSNISTQRHAKEEIELIMSEIQTDIKSLKGSPTRKVQTPQPNTQSELAASTLKPKEVPQPPSLIWKGLFTSVLGAGESRAQKRRATVSFKLHKDIES